MSLHYASLAELGRALRKKDVSSVELTQMYLGRLKTRGREHRAVAELTEEHALAQARRADSTEFKHALHGIPFGAKDLYATAGIPTRWGSGAHADQIFDYNATAVEKLYQAGGVLVAKLAMIALAGGGDYNHADASATGACLCAWDKTRWAGGSSSGSGAATALGCVAYSLGSETSGSITCPSAFNGLTGFRPTYGRVSRHGAMALCWTLDKVGPMARSAEDCALVLQTIAGHDPLDRSTLRDRLNLRSRGPKPVIGLLKEQFNANNAAGKKAYEETIAVLKKLGYDFVDVAYPPMPYGLAVGLIVDAEGASAHEHMIRDPQRLKIAGDANQAAGLAAALDTKAVDYLWAMRFRTEALKANEVWEKCDAIFSPVFYKGSIPADKPFSETWRDMGGDGGPANLLGWPAMAFPIGFEDGAPLGGQIIAPAMREDLCYRIVREFQRATDLHLKRPPEG